MNVTAIRVVKRAADQRGTTELGWLHSRHTFSFGEYYDSRHMGYHGLRVINDDTVEPGGGFGTHPHRDMEILSYVISGELAHQDSLGNGRTIRSGELQYMSAGSGVLHSEFNPSAAEPVHFLQIWIEPAERGGRPLYADMDTNALKQADGLALFASPDGRGGSVRLRQDAEIHFGHLRGGHPLAVAEDPGHPFAWIHVIAGTVEAGGAVLGPGDGAAIEAAGFELSARDEAEFLLFRLT